MDEMTAETNVEEFDDVEVDAGLDGAEAQATEPEERIAGETTDEGTERESEQKNPEKEPEKPFVKKGNDENRDRRIAQREKWRREREEAERLAYQKGIVDSVGGVNPYNNQKIEDEADIQEFLAMREIEKSGGDPISDYPSYMKKKAREQAQKAVEEAKEQEQKGWFQKDFQEFLATHPDLDFEALQKDEEFQLFADGKIGNQSLTKIYDDFIKVSGKYQAEAQKTAQKLMAKSLSSPGALSGGDAEPAITDADIEKYLEDAIRGKFD